jgi:hypothetical protein
MNHEEGSATTAGQVGAYRTILLLAILSPSALAAPLNSTVRLDENVHFEGPGLGPYPIVSANVGLYSITAQEIFFKDGFIDMDFLVHDLGGGTAELSVYHSVVYNATLRTWLGFQIDFGFKDENGTFVNSTNADGLGFATIVPGKPSFTSNVFSAFEVKNGGETLLWNNGILRSPGYSLYVYRIVVPASNAFMPAFALRDGGYAFTLRQRPIFVNDVDPPPAIVPEPGTFTLYLSFVLTYFLVRCRKAI